MTINGDGADEPNDVQCDPSNPVNATIDRGTGQNDHGRRSPRLPIPSGSALPGRGRPQRAAAAAAGADRTLPVAGAMPRAVRLASVGGRRQPDASPSPPPPASSSVFPREARPLPTASSINYKVGQTRANNGIFGPGPEAPSPPAAGRPPGRPISSQRGHAGAE